MAVHLACGPGIAVSMIDQRFTFLSNGLLASQVSALLVGKVAMPLSRQRAKLWEERAHEAEAQHAAIQRELAVLDRQDASDLADFALCLPAQRILYVGGRLGCTERMRVSLEAVGGALLCHDGGRHDHPSLLPGLISQADRVAFPVDCMSHDAALTVKRLCRQLGKPWLPLRSAGLGSFLAALATPGGHVPSASKHSNGASL